ncbi:MAG: hypothetical protein NTV00_08820 [Methylococcales bacterium]|nr:hypothetical protein [Methylococcales bacterium]
MDETKKWTNLSCAKIGSLLAEEGFKVSRNIVRKLLKKNGYVKRKALKMKAAGGHVNRNAQFETIGKWRALYTAAGNPVISVDAKKIWARFDFALVEMVGKKPANPTPPTIANAVSINSP